MVSAAAAKALKPYSVKDTAAIADESDVEAVYPSTRDEITYYAAIVSFLSYSSLWFFSLILSRIPFL